MDRAQIESTIAALDARVPKEDARVMIQQYGGGPDECVIVANERGYLRLGIELLKAAYAPAVLGNNRDSISVDLDYLLMEGSEVRIDGFERRDPEAPRAVNNWSLADAAAMACGLFLVSMFIVGCMTVVSWLISHF